MKVQMRDISTVTPYEKNPRLNEAAVDAVAASIKEFGFRQPVVVDEQSVIIVGHTRLLAAQKLGLTEIPVHIATGLSPEQVRAYRIADNKLHELSDWNFELLPVELSELQGSGFDLDLLGFDKDELAKLLDTGVQEGLTDPDDVPEPPDEAITKLGDLWILPSTSLGTGGEHRLLCGDAGKTEDVDRLLNGAKIQLVNTDPPYNVRVEPRSGNAIAAGRSSFAPAQRAQMHHQSFDEARQGKKHATTRKLRPRDRVLEGDWLPDEEFASLLRVWFGQMARVLEPGRSFFIWGVTSVRVA